MIFRATFLALLTTSIILQNGSAASIVRSNIKIGKGWRGRSSIENGRLLACSAHKYVPEGMSPSLYLNGRGTLLLLLYKARWRLSTSMAPDFTVRIDRTILKSVVHEVRRDSYSLILPKPETALVEFAAGSSLISSWRGIDVATSLEGSQEAVNFVLGCGRNYGSPELKAKLGLGLAPRPRPKELESSSGSGFFVSHNGKVLTNSHVAATCKRLNISSQGSAVVSARAIAIDEKNDLALLETGTHPLIVGRLRRSPRLGETIHVFGFPLVGLLSTSGNFTSGDITAVSGMGDDTRLLQISAPVQPGNSGGPLLDQAGNIVGVIVSKLNVLRAASLIDDLPQNINFAIKTDIAWAFLESHGVAQSANNLTASLNGPDIADMARKMAVLIRCN